MILSVLLLAATDAPGPIEADAVLPATAPVIDAVIGGHPVRLRVDPGAETYITLSGSAAARLRLADPERRVGKARVERGTFRSNIGRARFQAPWTEEKVEIAGASRDLMVISPASGEVPDADGLISPASLPYRTVTLAARQPTTRDQTFTVPASFERNEALRTRLVIGGVAIQVEHHPNQPTTFTTAYVGSVIAATNAGKLAGAYQPVTVAFGVQRPARELRLGTPLRLFGQELPALLVRVHDWDGGRDRPPELTPSEDIPVYGRRMRAHPVLRIGADVLARCASITWSRPGQSLSFVCPR